MKRGEDRIIYSVLIAIGIIPVATTWANGTSFGWEPTVGLLFVVLGLVGWVVSP